MIKLLHAADLHLDSPFAALSPAQARIQKNDHESRDKTSLLELLFRREVFCCFRPALPAASAAGTKNFVPK